MTLRSRAVQEEYQQQRLEQLRVEEQRLKLSEALKERRLTGLLSTPLWDPRSEGSERGGSA